MRKLDKKVSTKIVAIVLVAVAAFSLMGCTVEKTVTTTETYTDADGNTITTTQTTDESGNVENVTAEVEPAESTDLITYEFETFDNLKIVLDENSITVQESSDDPENSELISEEARGNIIAPGRDFVYLEDDDYYYVADLSRNLITVADKSKVAVDVAN